MATIPELVDHGVREAGDQELRELSARIHKISNIPPPGITINDLPRTRCGASADPYQCAVGGGEVHVLHASTGRGDDTDG